MTATPKSWEAPDPCPTCDMPRTRYRYPGFGIKVVLCPGCDETHKRPNLVEVK